MGPAEFSAATTVMPLPVATAVPTPVTVTS
jgi:hypothetical protein